jgi:hypothetical protein
MVGRTGIPHADDGRHTFFFLLLQFFSLISRTGKRRHQRGTETVPFLKKYTEVVEEEEKWELIYRVNYCVTRSIGSVRVMWPRTRPSFLSPNESCWGSGASAGALSIPTDSLFQSCILYYLLPPFPLVS